MLPLIAPQTLIITKLYLLRKAREELNVVKNITQRENIHMFDHSKDDDEYVNSNTLQLAAIISLKKPTPANKKIKNISLKLYLQIKIFIKAKDNTINPILKL